ncbi:MAG TPA: cytochrome c oxidase subunit 3 [Bacteroidia bacterium]|nr:cytochrome c oxidase subunit 3 [Bacteroidia bacterium]
MITTTTNTETTYTKIPTFKLLLWLAMVSMVMMFAGLTSGYIVRQADGNWFEFELPSVFYISTAFILLSSISMQWAFAGVKKDNLSQLRIGLMTTLGLGLGFIFTQFTAWSKLVEAGVFFTGNPSGSFLYVLTALHLAHLFGGMIFLIVVTTRSIQGHFSSKKYLPVELCTTFWHFLDGLWIYLFVFLILVR